MRFLNLIDDGQAEPTSALVSLTGWVSTVKPLKQKGQILGGDAGTCVTNGRFHPAIRNLAPNLHPPPPAGVYCNPFSMIPQNALIRILLASIGGSAPLEVTMLV